MSSISSHSSSFCAAVDLAGYATTFNGVTWSALTAPVPTNPVTGLTAVSCASASFCAAIDGPAGTVVMYNGTTWSMPLSIDPAMDTASVSCPSAQFCVALDQN